MKKSNTCFMRLLVVTTALLILVSQITFTQHLSSETQKRRHFRILQNESCISALIPTFHDTDWKLSPNKDEEISSPSSTNSYNWQLKLSTPGYWLKDVSFANQQVGYIAAEVGPVFKTINGGENWQQIDIDAVHYWWGIDALSPDTVVVSGIDTTGLIRWTFDGGSTWSEEIRLPVPGGANIFWSDLVHFFNSDTGIVKSDWEGGFYRTTNGGQNSSSWTYIQVDPQQAWFAGNMDAQPSGHIYATGIRNAHSSDFGETWTVTPCADYIFDNGVDYLDDDRSFGWTGGGSISPQVAGWVARTTNGGQSWIRRIGGTFPYPIRAVKFFSQTSGIAVGGDNWSGIGGIYSTTNGGNTWILNVNTGAEMSSIETIRVSNDSVDVWCCGASSSTGKLYKTRIYLPNIVPVELTSFTATTQNGYVELNWATATELNNLGFEVQRSVGKSDFVTIGFVEGNGTATAEHNYNFKDKNVTGSLKYRLKQIDFNGSYEYSDIIEVEVLGSISYQLSQNYPNPFNPTTNIGYQIPVSTYVTLKVYDVLGKEVATLVDGNQEAGYHNVQWSMDTNGSFGQLSSGVYYYRLEAGTFLDTKKMLLVR